MDSNYGCAARSSSRGRPRRESFIDRRINNRSAPVSKAAD
jgi:hypothetical protein